ncbi:hypothetical protein [Streptomyces sp. ST2-7A]|uniref:hypothetical protein n=1 Tax=Streptomyces sp. ST2-7A TaxID=2907214 RepID=UPI001F1AB062|nr:hypothetical protein [Streptomyces sp. ST2-7A]MCE7082404.1 hypothetical protein [Streptomyces sp. ST2-7A]
MSLMRFVDALTHSGPGYLSESDPGNLPETRSSPGRFLDALAHRGPGYGPPSPGERLEMATAVRRGRELVTETALGAMEQLLYAKGHIDALAGAGDERERREHASAALDELGEFLRYTRRELPPASTALREALGPLDLRNRISLLRTERSLRRLESSVTAAVDHLRDVHAREAPGAPDTRMDTVLARPLRRLCAVVH